MPAGFFLKDSKSFDKRTWQMAGSPLSPLTTLHVHVLYMYMIVCLSPATTSYCEITSFTTVEIIEVEDRGGPGGSAEKVIKSMYRRKK